MRRQLSAGSHHQGTEVSSRVAALLGPETNDPLHHNDITLAHVIRLKVT